MVEFRNEIRSRQDSEDSDVSFEDMLNHYEAEIQEHEAFVQLIK